VWPSHRWHGDADSGTLEDSQPQALIRDAAGGTPMDEALRLVIEMNDRIWKRFKADLQDVTPEEID
jgi:hypothetical protein